MLAACSGGGGGGASPTSTGDAGAVGVVRLIDHEPADGAIQVATDAEIMLRFDAPMALESFGDPDTWLRTRDGGLPLAGSFRLATLQRVYFRPAAPLAAETDYEFQLSPLTCDQDGRIVDVEQRFVFRTIDATPPIVAAVDVAQGAIHVARDRSFTVTFSERVAPASVTAASVYLRDQFGVRYPATLAIDDATVVLDPLADLPGDRALVLVATTAVRDAAGNALADTFQRTCRTAVDDGQPEVLDAWPPQARNDVSPRAQPQFVFDESMDPASVEMSSLSFVDEFQAIVPFHVAASPDQRTLRIVPDAPLAAGRGYTMTFALGAAAATDVSGNALAATQTRSFRTGSDAAAPVLVASVPAVDAQRVPGTVVAELQFDEALAAELVAEAIASVEVDGAPWDALVETPTSTSLRLTPLTPLPPGAACALRVRGGPDGLRDQHGNFLGADLVVAFTTSDDLGTPTALLLPPDGAADVARNAAVSVTFDAPMDPATLLADAVTLTDDGGAPIACAVAVDANTRNVRLQPLQPLAANTFHRVRVRGGAAGVRRASGNWLPTNLNARFRTGGGQDLLAPNVSCTVNGIAASRQQGLTLPPSGFTIECEAFDATGYADVGRCEVVLQGPGPAPATAALAADATIGFGFARLVVPATSPLAAGAWTLQVRVPDLAGNVAASAALPFDVAAPTNTIAPFDQTQVVWVRTDLDQDGNGRTDFDDDLVRLGLGSDGGHAGSQDFVRRTLLAGILEQVNRLYGRGVRGEPVGADSVAIRFTPRAPIKVAHMQMALGGLDPGGAPGRSYGAESTGVLGRAVFDLRNGNPAERNLGSAPGLGVFPSEMFLYQARLHQQVHPSFVTAFAQRFLPLCPPMGGTPVGSHVHDAAVLRDDYDAAAATSAQRARRTTVIAAIDDWAKVVGIVLAHEVGHSVGLVAPGAAPVGLYGDASLHDSYAGATEVMAAAVGYESMVSLAYAFRDIDMAYLRHRVLLR